MEFAKRMREGVREGRITCTVRIWKRLQVRLGGRYRMEEGEIEVESITPIGFPDITPQLARESGFAGVLHLLKVAKHGSGDKIYLIRFHYVAPHKKTQARREIQNRACELMIEVEFKRRRLSRRGPRFVI